MKLNFSLLKNQPVCIVVNHNNKNYNIHGILLNVQESKTDYKFTFDTCVLQLNKTVFLHYKLTKLNGFYYLSYDKYSISGLVGFTMFDTYGFPMELTDEILSEKGFVLDKEGYEILRNLSCEKSQKGSKLTTAFK